MLHTTVTLLSFLCHYTSGVNITVINGGFETYVDGAAGPNTFLYSGQTIPDWTLYDEGALGDNSIGVVNPTSGGSFNDPIYGDSVPQGSQACYVEQLESKWIGEGEIGITQTLSPHVIETDTTYTLTVYIGNTGPNCWSNDSTEKDTCGGSTEFPGYRVQILANNGVLAEDDDSLTIPEGQWVKCTVTVSVYAGDGNIDKTLKIRLINKNGKAGDEVSFDNVQMQADPITTTTTTTTTTAPTENPSKNPSKNPTISPTLYPTLSPNNDPTVSPNNDPTVSPNIDHDPTVSPVDIPASVLPTYKPSYNPTINPTLDVTTSVNTAGIEYQSDDVVLSGVVLILTAIGVMVLLCCCCVIVFFIVCKIRETAQEDVTVEMSDDEQDMHQTEVNEDKERDQLTVKSFFDYDLNLPQYYAAFDDHGYDSLRAILMIKDKTDLIPLGVTLPGHQSLILSKIKCLREVTEGGNISADNTTEVTNVTDVQLQAVLQQTEEKQEPDRHEDAGADGYQDADGHQAADVYQDADGYQNADEIDEQMVKDQRMIRAWLDYNVGLAKYKYHEQFIKNGYESMKAIQAIRGKDELKEMGVKVLGHQTLILFEIEKLNKNVNSNHVVNESVPQHMIGYMLPPSPHMDGAAMEEGGGADYGFNPPGHLNQYGQGIQKMNQGLMQSYNINQIIEKQQSRMLEMQSNMQEADNNIRKLEETVGQ